MSHSVQAVLGSQLNVLVTIINYVAGGETVTLSDIFGNTGYISLDGLVMGSVSASQNSLGIPLFPILDGGKVKLYRILAGGAPSEIPTTTALNAVISAIVWGH